jgi:hypothetical protein
MPFAILEYREMDMTTHVYGPYATETEAKAEANVAAARIAASRTNVAGVRSGVREDEDGDLMVYDLDYEHEPSDDERHVLLQVVAMEPYRA